MKLINNYLSKNIAYPTFFIITILSAIILLTQSLKYIDLVVTHGISSLDFLYLSVLLLPSLLFIIIPICLFIAILYSLNKLNSHRELNILKGFGINNFKIAKPILKISLVVTIFHYFVTLYWMPEVNHKFKDLMMHVKESYVTFFLQEKVFNHPTNDLTFYIKNKINNNQFENIFFQDKNKGMPVTIVAKSGKIIKKDNKVFLSLTDGNRQELNKNGELNILNFDTLLWQLSANSTSDKNRTIGIQEKHLPELLFNDLPQDSNIKKKMFAEANQRIILPFYNIILTLLAISALLQGEFNRSGKTKRIIGFSILSGVIVIINTSLINLSANHTGIIILSYLFTLGVFGTLLYFLFYREG